MKILIVEDEIGIANFLKQGLEEEGYDVLVANDGKTGYDLALSQKVNVILLDWILPQMTGIEVCKSIRKTDSKTPIIFLTAKDTVQETIEGLKAGANDYIKKPFSFDELVERIKIHFRNENENDEMSLGNIKIIKSKHQILVDNQEIAFTQREFELLGYLIKNKGKVCTRNQIIEDVWDIHFEYDTGVIDVFMNAIRKKLNLNKDEELIKTIRGVGYIANDLN
ncbi:response regulator transcription factor [Flavobacterium gawalongense]|uniref:Response regulator transcription factor n=1 Tax=Flavobacterium gawalongense TaxID=2594432 RepID=A0A553BGH0_9FLAO|nr:response regulator transcription factor [Flavobacterium gawalongense]TRX00002.1 response regulator transcription factor [Flavobacterium gawalongense]TRX04768.1 response regulator transcription factor [Flavobacterium gawalongense]TRX07354.1 response regulator transcription factor [Flavobacterium gawalongense]TRX08371.1 response regulator transcription factor [Flavobacterium gawalongense]TRX24440.1 response regulator transcription factor [Flavobacterium gawalongense]